MFAPKGEWALFVDVNQQFPAKGRARSRTTLATLEPASSSCSTPTGRIKRSRGRSLFSMRCIHYSANSHSKSAARVSRVRVLHCLCLVTFPRLDHPDSLQPQLLLYFAHIICLLRRHLYIEPRTLCWGASLLGQARQSREMAAVATMSSIKARDHAYSHTPHEVVARPSQQVGRVRSHSSTEHTAHIGSGSRWSAQLH